MSKVEFIYSMFKVYVKGVVSLVYVKVYIINECNNFDISCSVDVVRFIYFCFFFNIITFILLLFFKNEFIFIK